MNKEQIEKVAAKYMIQCRNSKEFECPYLESCPHEDNDICEWQREQAREIIPIIEQEVRKEIARQITFDMEDIYVFDTSYGYNQVRIDYVFMNEDSGIWQSLKEGN